MRWSDPADVALVIEESWFENVKLLVSVKLIILTYSHTPWSRVLLEKLTGFAANQEIPRIL